ncbi:MAG: bifunctional (p)ppGpp synthetase/guanosine-3',5'-bis(diphosphate) 3'-pyrophosphohydrolase [Clostridiales bacterium]|jgi:GTP pyrophosphokinase|nr:bifunctional (p)ppGpp synthetase/guanosine-3',5'-bis(diphosphate) 3'-pyrophosphohydrolase [Clostridiales bacterium]
MNYNELYSELIEKISQYHPSQDLSIIEKAYLTALDAHKDQLRKSGEAYIIHPLSVSIILAELQLDLESIEAGLLHDVIEDSPYSYNDIANMFSEEVAQLVDGVTKLEKLPYTSKEEEQAENFRKMFIAMAKDIRVILIKIADRLHNMRTLKYQPEYKQKEIAQETLDIYAPLVHRLGISTLRYELEDLCFKYLHSEEYHELAEKINRKLSERQAFVNRVVVEIRGLVESEGIEASVDGRPKHFFSIYKKMVSQEKTLDQIYDLFAVRVIVSDVRDCYEVLGIVHTMYKPITRRFKDYIAMPKTNRYQSLHTTLISQEGEPFEVQIRTYEMHKTAEYGIAAHWKYKEGKGGQVNPDSEEAKLTWLRQILEWQRELSDNKEFMEALKVDLNVFKDHVYCFTPKGEVISLINGANPIDFAYAIHTAVGNKMIGARVNGKIVTIDYALSTGDRVEIITSQNSKGPSPNWLKLVKTSQARSKINAWFKRENREDNIAKGRDLLDKEAKRRYLRLSELLSDERLNIVLNKFNAADLDSLCASVGYGGIKESQVISKLFEEYQKENVKEPETLALDTKDSAARDRKKKSGIVVKGVGDVNVRFSKCCSPVPGDEIVGFVTRGRGISVHRTDCANIINMDEIDRRRLLEAEWQLPDKSANGVHYRAELRIVGMERVGFLLDISRVIAEAHISVKDMSARTVNNEAIITLSLEITSREELDHIRIRLRRISGVHEIERVIS